MAQKTQPDTAPETTPPADTVAESTTGESDAVTEYAAELAADYEKANLGCGDDYREDYLNVDIDEHHTIDFSWDLNDRPWPWPDNSFEKVVMHNVLEHLDDQLATLEEIHRITRQGGTVIISGPHWNSPGAWIDPTHTRPFTREMFEHELVRDKFAVVDERATCVRWGRLVPNSVALALADHISHGVSEIEVELLVRSDRYLDNRGETDG